LETKGDSMSILINGEDKIDHSVLPRLTDAIRKASDSPSYMYTELFCVLKQCLIAEPMLKHLIEEEIEAYNKLSENDTAE
jgi:hypothetical protein